ncbi:hypothetical protein ACFL08_04970 [Patescibacteria group bacterium]
MTVRVKGVIDQETLTRLIEFSKEQKRSIFLDLGNNQWEEMSFPVVSILETVKVSNSEITGKDDVIVDASFSVDVAVYNKLIKDMSSKELIAAGLGHLATRCSNPYAEAGLFPSVIVKSVEQMING